MESGFVKRIGDVIIQRVGATSNSSLSPPPSSATLKPSLNCSPHQLHQEQQQFMEGHSDDDIVPEPPPNFDPTIPSSLPLTDISGSLVDSEPLQMSSSPPLEHDDEEDDELDLERQEGTPGIPEGLHDEDIVPDFPEDDLNEDNTPEDEDHLNEDDPTLNEDPTMHEVDHNDELDDQDDPLVGEDDPDLEGSEDVLAGFKEGAGSSVALMESEDLLREIKPEPMELDGRDDEEQTGEQDNEEGDDEKDGGEESGKRKQESDDEEEKASKKKKSEEESELEKEKKKNAINFRRNIREVMDENQLDESTLAAQRQEAERLRRVQDQQKYLREMQMQRQMQMQMNKQNRTQSRIMSYLQSGSGSASLVKAGQPSIPMGSQPLMSKPNTVVVKLGSNAPPQLLNKKVLEAIRGGKSSPTPSDNRAGLTRLINKPHMVTPSVSIAPVKPAAMSADKKEDQFAPDVVTISSSDEDEDDERPSSMAMTMGESKVKEEPLEEEEDDDDCIVISEPSDVEEEEEEVDTNNSGMHTNDLFNCPDDQGRVLINVGKQEGEEEIFLSPQISRVIKPHQIGGVRFLFDNIIESAERYKTSTGFGCILAHSMGLGKTLQVVSFCDIFLRETPGRTIMCIMPINTLQNWMAEFNMWLPVDPSSSPLAAQGEVRARQFQIFVLNDLHKTIASRARVVAEWQKEGGVLLIGYEMYRQLSLRKPGRMRKGKKKNPDEDMEDVKNKPHLENMQEALVKPGPDLVICDEGHRIKNSHASISHALKQIRTKRRVVLTGYPLQNNLLEYWCMVDFVRPNYLGTKTEFSNMFERPIQNGQCIDSTPQDIRLMRYRAHVLHSLLEGFVQRRSHSVLRNSLPQKEEYVLLVRMNEFQRKLYDTFMNEVVRTKAVPNPLKAFAVCCKIWNHPDILYNFLKKRELDELQDLDLEETAALNPNQPLIPNSPRGKEGKGKKGKGGKKAPPVPIKPAATVPPTNSQPEVKSEGQNTNFPPNFDFNRDSQGNFNGPPQQQCEGYNSGSQTQGDFNNFNPNFRNEGYYQNYNNYPNYQQQGGYSGYSGSFNNYNNYYQGGNYGNNSYPAIKKEPEEFSQNDKKEELKFSQQKTMTGGQVVYNTQFGTNSVEPKKEFPPFNEWNQYGQSNYGSYSWPQDQEGDQKPKISGQEAPTNFPQTPNFPPQSNSNFQTQNFGDQSTSNVQSIQNNPNFGSSSNFGQQQSSSNQSGPQQGYQTPGYGAQLPPTNQSSNAMMNKTNFQPEFENQPTTAVPNPDSGFSQNFGSSSTNQANENFSSIPNSQRGSNQSTQGVQNFGSQSVPNISNQSPQLCYNSNFGNASQPNNVFASHTFENPSSSSNSQNYQQNYGTDNNVNPTESGFQQNFVSQPDPNGSSYNSNVTTLPGNQSVPSNFPADFLPDSAVPQTPQNSSNQPTNYPNNQMNPPHGFSNFGNQSGSEMQGVYSTPCNNNFGDNRGNGTQNVSSEANSQQHVQDLGNPDFYQNFVKTDPSRIPNQSNSEFPTNFQGSKGDSMPQSMYEGQSSQDYFNSSNQPTNIFRTEQPVNNQRFAPQTKKRDSHSEPNQQENIPGNVYNNENYSMGPPNTLNPVSNPTNQMNEFMVNTQTPTKTQPQMDQYGQPIDNYHQLGKTIQESPATGNYSSTTPGNFGMNEPNQCTSKTPFTGGKTQDTVSGFVYSQLGNKEGAFDSLGSKNSNPQMMNNFGPVQKNSQDMQPMNSGYVTNSCPEATSQDFGSRSNKELHDISLVGGFPGGQTVPDQSMNFGSGSVCRSLQEPQMTGYNQTMAPKTSIEQQMVGYDHGQQIPKSHQDKVGGSYGAGPSSGINVSNPSGNFTPSVSSKAPHDSAMYQTSNVPLSKNSPFKAPQEPHPSSGSYVNNMNAGTFEHGINSYNPAVKNLQEPTVNMPNYRPMGSKPQPDSEGSYQPMAGRNQQDQSCVPAYNSMGNMNSQDPSSYAPFGMKGDQQNNRMCDMGSQNQPNLQNMGSQCGMSKTQDSKSNYGSLGSKMGPEPISQGNFGPGGGTSQQQPMQGFQYNNQNMQTSTVNYGNQNFRDQGDEIFPSSTPTNAMAGPNQRPPYCNQIPTPGVMNPPNQINQGSSQMQPGTQMNQHGSQMQSGNQMNQHGPQMQGVNQLGQAGMNQHGTQMQSGSQMPTNQMNMPLNQHGNQGKEMDLSHVNQLGDMSYPSNMNVPQNNQMDQQGAYFKNNYDNFNQPGTSFADLKEKRGMSCQTEFDSNERAAEKDDMEGGNQGDDTKKEEDKKGGETQLAIPTGKSGKEDVGIPYDWAIELLKGYIPGDIHASGKMSVFFCILEESIALGDRILVFSQSLFTLNLMEDMLQKRDIPGKQEKWARNLNYFRLDGSTTAIEREKLINEFNSNPKLHLFLVSTRAGSLGINLVGANRVIVFDASWNPCHDTQAVCRVYRYGQKKPCFVYRLVTDNCLEKKIYDRQINKQGMSDRVVDECNPDAHLSIKEVTSLCWDDKADDTEVKDFTDMQDQYIDVVIQKVLQQHSKLLSKEPFQHESLLVDRKEKKLSQAEKRLAKRSYELEKQASTGANRPLYQNNMVNSQGGMIRGSDKPMASVRPMQSELGGSNMVRENRPRGWIPASVWQRQGMSAQEMTLPLDVVIPTNAPDRSSIVLKAGQKVMVLKSPKGIYMQLENGKIIAIRTAFKPGNQGGKDGNGGPKKSTGTGPEPPRGRNPAAIPTNLRNNAAVSITPRGPISSTSGSGRPFSQGNRPVRAVGPTHRPSPLSVTVTKKRPGFETGQPTTSQPRGRMGVGRSDESDGGDSLPSVSPSRPPPSPLHHDSRDSMASSSSQYGGNYSNSSRSNPVLPNFARDVSITPYSTKDGRTPPGNPQSGMMSSVPSGYREAPGSYAPLSRNEVSITPFSRNASMGGGGGRSHVEQDMGGREESRKEYDGGGGPPPSQMGLDYRSVPESRPFASVSLNPGAHGAHFRPDPLGHGDPGGSRGEPHMNSVESDRNKRAFQPYPSASYPLSPMDKGLTSGHMPYSPYQNVDKGSYDSKSHGPPSAMMRPSSAHQHSGGDVGMLRGPTDIHHHHVDVPKHLPHPMYHHRPPPQHLPPHDSLDPRYRTDKSMYHPSRPDSDKQFQVSDPDQSYVSSQKPYMQSEKTFIPSDKQYSTNEKLQMPNDKSFGATEKAHVSIEKPRVSMFPAVGNNNTNHSSNNSSNNTSTNKAEEPNYGFERSGSTSGASTAAATENDKPQPPPPSAFPLRPEAKQASHPYLPTAEKFGPSPPPPPGAPPPVPFYSGYPPPYGPNPFTAAAVSRSSFYPPPPSYYPPPFPPGYPQHPPPP